MINWHPFGGGRGPETEPGGPQPTGTSSVPPQETNQPNQETRSAPEQERTTPLVVPKKLAEEILPTVHYLYNSDKNRGGKTPKNEYEEFISQRSHDPIAILLDPDRIKTEREEQRIDQLVAEKIQREEAQNRDEVLQVLFREHLYAPPRVQQYWCLIRGLSQEKPIKPADANFLEGKLRSRKEHEDGMFLGDPRHWKGPKPPTKSQRRGFKAESDKMDRFLAQLNKLPGS